MATNEITPLNLSDWRRDVRHERVCVLAVLDRSAGEGPAQSVERKSKDGWFVRASETLQRSQGCDESEDKSDYGWHRTVPNSRYDRSHVWS